MYTIFNIYAKDLKVYTKFYISFAYKNYKKSSAIESIFIMYV